ncbi:3-hydroxyacyl-CoA dehydrogenase family protein [Paenibacillus dendritiformis]|uniref:3-hydroxyacyl-CoA dehydrogenase family protein n=1 Tax=Paenibacillus dendritiformis TaxID=130049 RepID=UPI00387E0795
MVKKIGVIGAGVMGKGVAQAFAQSGYPVVLIDVCENLLLTASEEIYNNVRFQGLFRRGEAVADPDAVLSRIRLSTDYELLADVDYVVENVTERWETKKEVYQKLDRICPDDVVILVNTSCISITKIAALTKRPSRIAGAHFMNPVPLKPAVEVIRGYHTADSTIEEIKDLLLSIGKETIVVNDYPGFVSNRISHLFMNEAAFVVQDQVASPQEVDEIFKKCYSHTMGPLETADLIGLDTVMQSLDVLYESYQDSKFRCCPLLRKMVEAGLCGRKSGQGFYTYE